MALRTLIVEDEIPARKRLEKLILEYGELELIDSAINGKDGLEKIKKYSPDLVFLDIELKDYTAFEMLERIENHNFKIIFVTAHNQYAVNAFDIQAIDYLMKPFSKERLTKAVNRIVSSENQFDLKKLQELMASYQKIQDRKVIIPEGNTNHFIDGDEIEYIYSQGYYVNLVMNNKKKVIRISLKAMESFLPSNFYRINKSTIVNAEKINQLIKNKTSLKIITKDRNEFFVTDKFRKDIEMKLNFEIKS